MFIPSQFLTFFTFIPLILYTAAITMFCVVVFRAKKGTQNNPTPPVSIIIPFRNEEKNIPPLVHSLTAQRYPNDIELVFIDDNSSDNGRNVLNSLLSVPQSPDHKILTLNYDPKTMLSSKQQALELGVSESKHPLIIFSDADMRFKENWVEDLVRSMDKEVALVFGHTSVLKEKSAKPAQVMESFQLELLFCFAYAFDKANLCGSGMGNNILFRKSAYLKCGGQKAIGYSIVEDRDLLSLFHRKGYKFSAQEPFLANAFTYPHTSIKQFLNQLRRWASGGLAPGSNLLPFALLLFFQNFIFLTMFSGVLPMALSALTTLNFFLTWLFTALCFKKIGSTISTLLFPLYYIFLIGEILLWGVTVLLRRKLIWKNRVLSKETA
ncbi:Glycosyl transferase [Chitinispirillum alkaliphilum]|nr:Glycosyl transferase [Chitinispirillum alkaliphilum]